MDRRSFFIKICQENHDIILNNSYECNGKKIQLNYSCKEHQCVEVLTPAKIYDIQNDKQGFFKSSFRYSDRCDIQVVNADSYKYPTELVMNFANAIHPGGGYLHGALAQEECLCRESTLYASISSNTAKEMYNANTRNKEIFDTEYILLSPYVEVFRNDALGLLEKPYTLAVMTIAAPNRLYGKAKMANQSDVAEYMKKRIRQYLICGAYYGYRTTTLGAWGCGAFGNDAKDVAGYFKEILINEGYQKYYDKILFAVYDTTKEQYRYNAFKKAFQ